MQRHFVIDQKTFQIFGMLVDVLWVAFIRGFVTLPFNKSPANRVLLKLIEALISRQELASHRIRVMEIALRRVEDDVLQRKVQRCRTERYFVRFIGI